MLKWLDGEWSFDQLLHATDEESMHGKEEGELNVIHFNIKIQFISQKEHLQMRIVLCIINVFRFYFK